MTEVELNPAIPKDIHSEAGCLAIAWSDGHKGLLPFRFLRLACPCAACIHEWTRENLIDESQILPDVRPVKAEYVGRYALHIDWSDGHGSGFYTFEHLREICQCQPCKAKKGNP